MEPLGAALPTTAGLDWPKSHRPLASRPRVKEYGKSLLLDSIIPPVNSLKDKLALITGGSRGIGHDIADLFAAEGAQIVITYRNEDAGKKAVSALQAKHPGASIRGFACDVADGAAVEALFQAIGKETPVDILVNNAGITKDGLILRMKEEDWDAVLDTNLKGTFLMCKAAIRVMLKARKGHIINIASVVALIGNPGQANYSASKGGIISLTKSLAREVASRGITVNAIAPGYIETDMTSELTPEVKAQLMANIPLGRLGSGRDIAEAALFLAGEGSAYVTGQVLSVNGGLAMV